MFDPFGDGATAGYLRNVMAEKDPSIIQHVQHDVFRANLPQAIEYLASRPKITYAHFLQVHKILFGDFYPWAGQDRRTTAPNSAIRKGDPCFAIPPIASVRWSRPCGRRRSASRSPRGPAT